MKLERVSTAGSRVFLIVGWILSAIPILMMGVGGVVTIFNPEQMAKGMSEMGYPSHLAKTVLGLELAFALLYAFPRTAVLGAILLTAYLGGAVATHLRVSDDMWPIPVVFGVIVWLGLFLRDARLRALVPLRR
jgi:uncharacterized membrane protein